MIARNQIASHQCPTFFLNIAAQEEFITMVKFWQLLNHINLYFKNEITSLILFSNAFFLIDFLKNLMEPKKI
jgi:hypothetical protein